MNPNEQRELYKSLRERIYQLRMSHLFENPCDHKHDDEDGEPRIFV